MTVFRKVLVSDRKPPLDTPVIGGWDHDTTASIMVQREENGYWFLANKELGPADCDEPDWWLEEVPVPPQAQIDSEADRQFPHGRSAEADGFKRGGEWMYNRILRKLT